MTSELRLQGGREGLEKAIGALPDATYVYVDAGDGTVELGAERGSRDLAELSRR